MFTALVSLHRKFARLHGGGAAYAGGAQDLTALYRAYARATVTASQMLRKHGKDSAQFAAADIASMRLFHRVKNAQGLKKASSSPQKPA